MDTQEILSEINIHNKYATHINEKKRRETWDEVVDRVTDMHLVKLSKISDTTRKLLSADLLNAMDLVRGKKILPSMRSLQFAGKPIFSNPSRLYNCSFVNIENIDCFSETLYLLLSGVGVGFSVQKHHVSQLPIIRKSREVKTYIIPDSIEGWSESIKFMLEGFLTDKPYTPVFDYSLIRPKGSLIEGISGKAPGHEPLEKCHKNILKILSKKKKAAKLTSLEVHDIICYLADTVLAGGIRRSATISLFSKDDQEMMGAKTGSWWEQNMQRARANNSVVLDRSTTSFLDFWKIWRKVQNSGSGEPGIFFSNDLEMGTNPCAEISLSNHGFCNLVEVNTSNIESQEDLNERVYYATVIATIQASYTDFKYLRNEWKDRAEDDALIGVSLTGIADGSVLNYDLTKAADIVKQVNENVSRILGIKTSKRCTTVKPSGNSSIVLKTSAGIHARHAPYYWRRLRINLTDPLLPYLKTVHPHLLEFPHNEDVFIVKVAVKSPENAIFRNEGPLNMLSRIKKVFREWISEGHREGNNKNNVSATVSIKKHEWFIVGLWMWFNRNNYNGISVLPYDGGTYSYMPYEDCTEEDYNKFVELSGGSSDLFLENVEELFDGTNFSGEVACGGGGCDL